MMKLLKIKIEGVRNFENNLFEFDFTPSQRVTENEIDSDIFQLSKNIQINSNLVITGINASGKSTSLKLVDLVYNLIGLSKDISTFDEKKLLFMNSSFKDEVAIKTFWYSDDYNNPKNEKLYYLESNLIKEDEEFSLFNDGFEFVSETFKMINPKNIKSKKDLFDIEFMDPTEVITFRREDVENSLKNRVNTNKLEDSSGLGIMEFGLRRFQSMTSNLKPFKELKTISLIDSNNFNKIPSFIDNANFDENVEIIKLFDPSVEDIKKMTIKQEDRMRNTYSLKFYNQNSIQLTTSKEFSEYLSTGTLQGLEILCKAREVLKQGGILLIDEVENHLNKTIIKMIIELFLERVSNPNKAVLVFSTHYGELLDLINRRDSIYILDKDKNLINISKASKFTKFRNELKHSALLFGGHFGTGIEHQRLTNIQSLFEIKKSKSNGEKSKW